MFTQTNEEKKMISTYKKLTKKVKELGREPTKTTNQNGLFMDESSRLLIPCTYNPRGTKSTEVSRAYGQQFVIVWRMPVNRVFWSPDFVLF